MSVLGKDFFFGVTFLNLPDDRYVRPMALGNIDERELLGYLIHSTVACRADKVRSHSGRGLSAVFQTPVVSSFALASEE